MARSEEAKRYLKDLAQKIKMGGDVRSRALGQIRVVFGEELRDGRAGWDLKKQIVEVVRKAGGEEAAVECEDILMDAIDPKILKEQMTSAFQGSILDQIEATKRRIDEEEKYLTPEQRAAKSEEAYKRAKWNTSLLGRFFPRRS